MGMGEYEYYSWSMLWLGLGLGLGLLFLDQYHSCVASGGALFEIHTCLVAADSNEYSNIDSVYLSCCF